MIEPCKVIVDGKVCGKTEGVPVDCKRCKHHWHYIGGKQKAEFAHTNCPRCRTSLNLKPFIEAQQQAA